MKMKLFKDFIYFKDNRLYCPAINNLNLYFSTEFIVRWSMLNKIINFSSFASCLLDQFIFPSEMLYATSLRQWSISTLMLRTWTFTCRYLVTCSCPPSGFFHSHPLWQILENIYLKMTFIHLQLRSSVVPASPICVKQNATEQKARS